MFYDFGEELYKARKTKGWTHIQAAMKINSICVKKESVASPDSLSKWERGEVLPKIEAVHAMAQVYNKPDLYQKRIAAIELATKEKSPAATGLNEKLSYCYSTTLDSSSQSEGFRC
ncbi:MAG: hypothetical protein H6Q72_917 [Firmicutes bacterium]|nr:hypothetical protein [Bacillota bacterium]